MCRLQDTGHCEWLRGEGVGEGTLGGDMKVEAVGQLFSVCPRQNIHLSLVLKKYPLKMYHWTSDHPSHLCHPDGGH